MKDYKMVKYKITGGDWIWLGNGNWLGKGEEKICRTGNF